MKASFNPDQLIELLRTSRFDSEFYFMNGGCWELFCILKKHFPDAKPYHAFSGSHIATMINGVLYDIRGKVKKIKVYSPYSNIKNDKPHRWSKGFLRLNIGYYLAEWNKQLNKNNNHENLLY